MCCGGQNFNAKTAERKPDNKLTLARERTWNKHPPFIPPPPKTKKIPNKQAQAT